jgi:hypothetical protein
VFWSEIGGYNEAEILILKIKPTGNFKMRPTPENNKMQRILI